MFWPRLHLVCDGARALEPAALWLCSGPGCILCVVALVPWSRLHLVIVVVNVQEVGGGSQHEEATNLFEGYRREVEASMEAALVIECFPKVCGLEM